MNAKRKCTQKERRSFDIGVGVERFSVSTALTQASRYIRRLVEEIPRGAHGKTLNRAIASPLAHFKVELHSPKELACHFELDTPLVFGSGASDLAGRQRMRFLHSFGTQCFWPASAAFRQRESGRARESDNRYYYATSFGIRASNRLRTVVVLTRQSL